jgi:ribonuclease III
VWLKRLLSTSALSASDKELALSVKGITGIIPKNVNLYRLAFTHSSMLGNAPSATVKPEIGTAHNERLEYLGDAILGAVIADYLFKKYPLRDEGFLTEMRSRIVNRESLSALAMKIGVHKLLEINTKQRQLLTNRTMHGDAMEALIGAVYLDKGYQVTRQFIIKKLIGPHYDLDALLVTDSNHKSKLLEWASKKQKQVKFQMEEEDGKMNAREFTASVYIDDEKMGSGKGVTKKKAEQAAAEVVMLLIQSNV